MSTAIKSLPKTKVQPATLIQANGTAVYRFTVDQYHRMIEADILTSSDPVELLEGRIVFKMPKNPPHDGAIGTLTKLLARMLPEEWMVRIQSAITLRDSEPEPDLSIVRGPDQIYHSRHPRPDDTALLIEVAESSLIVDREYKGMLYARARISEYWIVNLVDAQVEVYMEPRGGKTPAYRQQQVYRKGDEVPLVLSNREIGSIPVNRLFS